MCAWIVPPTPGVIEPSIAPEFFVDDIGAIEITNGIIRIYLVADQSLVEAKSAPPQRIVRCKIVGPVLSVPMAIGKLALCMVRGERAHPPPDDGPWPRLVQ